MFNNSEPTKPSSIVQSSSASFGYVAPGYYPRQAGKTTTIEEIEYDEAGRVVKKITKTITEQENPGWGGPVWYSNGVTYHR